jgi:hypothetical protein
VAWDMVGRNNLAATKNAGKSKDYNGLGLEELV